MSFRKLFYQFVCLVLATNYFAFQVELFEDEYEANHPKQSETASFSLPSLNWESFDKNNAPEAFVVDAGLCIELLFELPATASVVSTYLEPFELVRDKSPPFFS